MLLHPATTDPEQLLPALRQQGYAVLAAQGVAQLAGCAPAELEALRASWHALAPDAYLKDGGHYRQRRHASFVVEGGSVAQVPHRAHWQPVEYNALHGGMQRWFEPVQPDIVTQPAWTRLLQALAAVASGLKGAQPWFVEAHQFRIDTAGGIGRPTPEGAHRDGVDLVAVFLVAREGIKGGETRVFQSDGPAGQRFTLTEPWSALLLDDERVIHETTPIQPVHESGYRDTLVVTCRAGAFQDA
ncbi:2OG-Fe dioxygenase family protein [Ramlibacter alkalitolerans]|uniref:2OG-Fe dioxygenase family protein n=1 Tax=Ramlibacter alkalitolerans TaxID=2039631 RepID=A0ABS1JXQ1_9BURK|nr:2OG-Fe dioxygenase family protein [Ramlibacter alkalitolerans]MBL0428235.1 2OG-Fe dioxygenase family protein [Ramlibacter alkalitolerans]